LMWKWGTQPAHEEKVNGWRNVLQEEVERRMSRVHRGKVTVGGMTSMARAKTKKSRTKRAARQSEDHGIGRRGVLKAVGIWLADKTAGGVVSTAAVTAVSWLLTRAHRAPVSRTPITASLNITLADAVAVGESHVVAFGEDASRASRHRRDVMVV
jgi:hypothetical protein